MFCLTSANNLITDSDNEIIDRCLLDLGRHESGALEELYRKTSTSIYSFALSILKNTDDAQDILHDSYVQIYSAAQNYSSQKKPMAWILTVTKNLCLKKLNDKKRMTDANPQDFESLASFDPSVSAENKVIIEQCLNLLSDSERQIVILHAVSGFKHREIAHMLKIPVATVLSKYNRAIKKLQKIL